MSKPNETFPALLHNLEPGDEGYDLGATLMMEQLDYERFYFKSRAGVDSFCSEQGFVLVNEEEMRRLREEYGKSST